MGLAQTPWVRAFRIEGGFTAEAAFVAPGGRPCRAGTAALVERVVSAVLAE